MHSGFKSETFCKFLSVPVLYFGYTTLAQKHDWPKTYFR